jgi:hypothetical protein
MFNNRIVIAQAQLLREIFLAKGKDYAGYAGIISNYDGVFKALASWLMARDFDQAQTDDIIGHLVPYIKKGRLKTNEIIVSPNAVKIKNSEPYTELIPFVDFIHGAYPTALARTKDTNEATERAPVLIGEGIKIYEVNNANDSRELASDTPWCIAYPGQNNMWTSYRSGGASTFFIVYDDNPPTPDQRKVAIDFKASGVELTDIPNYTGQKLSNGMDWDYYSEYLKSKGINLGATRINSKTGEEEKILQNKPLSDEEKFFLQYYDIFKSSQISVDQVKKWARGILEFESKDISDEKSFYGPREFFIEDYKHIDEREKSLKLVIRQKNKYGMPRPVFRIPIKREQIVSLVYKSGEKYSLDNPASSIEDIQNGSPLDLSKKQFGGYEETEPLSEVKLKVDDAKNYLTKFVGLGYLLPNEVFDYVMDLPDGKELITQYVDTGITLPEEQIEKIKAIPALFKTYARKQLIALSRNSIQDTSILNHLDPNDEKTKNTVLELLLPKDVKNVLSPPPDSMLSNLNKIPENWLNVPQIAVLFMPSANYSDPLAIKVCLAMGIVNYLKNYPTFENALIYLHDTQAINSFKDEAISQKYLPAIFEPFFNSYEYKKRWKNIELYMPSIVKDPRLNKFRAFGESDVKNTNDTTDENTELVYERAAIRVLNGNGNSLQSYSNDVNFWLYLINNFENLLNTVFKNVHYETDHITYFDDDGNEVDPDDYPEEELEQRSTTEYDRNLQKSLFLKEVEKTIPSKVLETPEILEALKIIFPQNRIFELVSKKGINSEYLLEYSAQFINSFSDLDNVAHRFIFEKDNPIIRKLTQNGFDVDDFLKKYSFSPLYYIRKLDKWNPGLITNISDKDFLKILEAENGVSVESFSWICNKRPYVVANMLKVPALANNITFEQRHYIFKNLLPRLQQPEQTGEAKVEETEQIPEEPTTAFVKSMLKIAQKLDYKRAYNLADKFTNILRKYNVQ